MADNAPRVLCISSTHKGDEMLRAFKKAGWTVILMIEEEFKDDPWAHEAIDEMIITPNLAKYQDVINTVTYIARGWQIDLILPLDEFETELVSMLREHMRLPGMRISETRRFRDKLAMRDIAQDAGIPVPDFVQVLNYDKLRDYMDTVDAPWMLKPRMEAGAMGIQKIHESEDLWRALDELGDVQSHYLMEQFLPGDVYHVDTLSVDGKSVFVSYQQYVNPPIDIYQKGGVFATRTVKRRTKDATELKKINEKVIRTLGIENGVTHAEFIKAHEDGKFYFLEVAARVGGAFVSDMMEHASGINFWREWARLEQAMFNDEKYSLPDTKQQYAALMLTLSRQEHPDMSAYDDPEIVWRSDKPYHAGLIIVSDDYDRVEALQQEYMERFVQDFSTSAPPMGTQRTGQSG
ncbi:MAG: ATP-grasp domain-containing protein [Aggregatilineales bacterium]